MTKGEGSIEMRVLLVGEDGALLEGLSQSLAAVGYVPSAMTTLHDAREAAAVNAPLLAVVQRELATQSDAEALGITLAPGGAMVLFHGSSARSASISPTLQRTVLADLTLPLERNRLIAIAQHVHERVLATGRAGRRTPPEQRAL
jgi:DNA-binding NtrC family response regulator